MDTVALSRCLVLLCIGLALDTTFLCMRNMEINIVYLSNEFILSSFISSMSLVRLAVSLFGAYPVNPGKLEYSMDGCAAS